MKFLVIIFSFIILTGCATPVKKVELQLAKQISDKSQIKPIAITKVVGKLRRGTEIGSYGMGAACITYSKINWKSGGKVNLNSEELTDVFREELEMAGWPVVGSTDDLFNGYDVSGAEVLVAAKNKELHRKFKGLSDNVVKEAFDWDEKYMKVEGYPQKDRQATR